MKKIVALILSVIYITASSGVVLNLHYCMGTLASVEVESLKSDNCSKCGMKANHGHCCHSEVKILKLDSSHKQAVIVASPDVPIALLPVNVSRVDAQIYSSKADEPVANGPPPLACNKIYLHNCVFRI